MASILFRRNVADRRPKVVYYHDPKNPTICQKLLYSTQHYGPTTTEEHSQVATTQDRQLPPVTSPMRAWNSEMPSALLPNTPNNMDDEFLNRGSRDCTPLNAAENPQRYETRESINHQPNHSRAQDEHGFEPFHQVPSCPVYHQHHQVPDQYNQRGFQNVSMGSQNGGGYRQDQDPMFHPQSTHRSYYGDGDNCTGSVMGDHAGRGNCNFDPRDPPPHQNLTTPPPLPCTLTPQVQSTQQPLDAASINYWMQRMAEKEEPFSLVTRDKSKYAHTKNTTDDEAKFWSTHKFCTMMELINISDENYDQLVKYFPDFKKYLEKTVLKNLQNSPDADQTAELREIIAMDPLPGQKNDVLLSRYAKILAQYIGAYAECVRNRNQTTTKNKKAAAKDLELTMLEKEVSEKVASFKEIMTPFNQDANDTVFSKALKFLDRYPITIQSSKATVEGDTNTDRYKHRAISCRDTSKEENVRELGWILDRLIEAARSGSQEAVRKTAVDHFEDNFRSLSEEQQYELICRLLNSLDAQDLHKVLHWRKSLEVQEGPTWLQLDSAGCPRETGFPTVSNSQTSAPIPPNPPPILAKQIPSPAESRKRVCTKRTNEAGKTTTAKKRNETGASSQKNHRISLDSLSASNQMVPRAPTASASEAAHHAPDCDEIVEDMQGFEPIPQPKKTRDSGSSKLSTSSTSNRRREEFGMLNQCSTSALTNFPDHGPYRLPTGTESSSDFEHTAAPDYSQNQQHLNQMGFVVNQPQPDNNAPITNQGDPMISNRRSFNSPSPDPQDFQIIGSL